MVYTVFYKTSSFAGYCFLDKNSIHPKRRDTPKGVMSLILSTLK